MGISILVDNVYKQDYTTFPQRSKIQGITTTLRQQWTTAAQLKTAMKALYTGLACPASSRRSTRT